MVWIHDHFLWNCSQMNTTEPPIDDKPSLVQVMALCHQAPSHYIRQFLPRYLVSLCHDDLTHWGRVMHICVRKLTIIGSDSGLSPDPHQAINAEILLIVNWILSNKPQWNFNRNSYICIEENAFEYTVWKMATILFLIYSYKLAYVMDIDMRVVDSIIYW